MKITLAKALKLKNRFASKLGEVTNDIYQYNSVIEGQERPVDIMKLMDKRSKLQDTLVDLKTAINAANREVQSIIYTLAELKGEINFLKQIDTTNGKQVRAATWGDDDKPYSKNAVIGYEFVQKTVEETEHEIDMNQDALDKHNHTVEIDLADERLALLRG